MGKTSATTEKAVPSPQPVIGVTANVDTLAVIAKLEKRVLIIGDIFTNGRPVAVDVLSFSIQVNSVSAGTIPFTPSVGSIANKFCVHTEQEIF